MIGSFQTIKQKQNKTNKLDKPLERERERELEQESENLIFESELRVSPINTTNYSLFEFSSTRSNNNICFSDSSLSLSIDNSTIMKLFK